MPVTAHPPAKTSAHRRHADVYDAVIIGGGFYGSVLALHLRRAGAERVALLEADAELMRHASYANQARVHNGYHYLRSLLTAVRSHANYPRFAEEFQDCVDDSFAKFYAVARRGSNVSAAQFRRFCERIGAPVEPAPSGTRRLFAPDLIEDVFLVVESAFDAVKLRHRLQLQLAASGVDVRLGVDATRIAPAAGDAVRIHCVSATGDETLTACRAFNCTYSRSNRLLLASGLRPVPLRHELTELALVRVPHELASMGITVVCGPYFSIMPFPPRGLHSLSHVRYTPHHTWGDDGAGTYRDPYDVLDHAPRVSNFPRMLRDACRYVPVLADCQHVESLWEVKTILPRSDRDDSRPIFVREDNALANLTTIVGAKIDNVYDMLGLPSLSRFAAAGQA